MSAEAFRSLVDRGDLDGLLREAEDRCDRNEWDAALALRSACRSAIERGHQLWPVASRVEYRLALDAPGVIAGPIAADPANGTFAPGPLTEVVATRHTWAELAPHVGTGPAAAIIAHERVVRLETLDGLDLPPVLDLPWHLERWEPQYLLPEFGVDGVIEATLPDVQTQPAAGASRARQPVDAAARALVDLVRTWTSSSNGRAEAVGVIGSAADAVATLGPARVRLAELSHREALALMAWGAASGGAHGRRRGSAVGRFDAWWVAAQLAGFDGLPEPNALGAAIQELRWYCWDAHDQPGGWCLRLAVEDPEDGLAWALHAIDGRL